jgi:hypothetical protein
LISQAVAHLPPHVIDDWQSPEATIVTTLARVAPVLPRTPSLSAHTLAVNVINIVVSVSNTVASVVSVSRRVRELVNASHEMHARPRLFATKASMRDAILR